MSDELWPLDATKGRHGSDLPEAVGAAVAKFVGLD